MKGKAKRYLRSLAVTEEPICHIGKGGISDNLIKQIDDALEAREIIKIRVLNNSAESARDIVPEITGKTHSELIQVIGHNIVVYRKSKTKPQIELPL